MATLSYSQSSYPKKIVLNNDTLVLITAIQLKQCNQKFNQLEYEIKLNKINDSIILYNGLRIENLTSQVIEYKANEVATKRTVDTLFSMCKSQALQNEQLNKKLKFATKIEYGLGGISAILLLFLIF